MAINGMSAPGALRVSILALATALSLPSAALAQDAPAQEPTAEDEVVITSFRGSLARATEMKREASGVVDTVLAEDIGKFPDSNLAESMQRVPGVTLARGDGGEGRNISVRGLGASFTRVLLNGIEGASQTSSSDIRGGGNRGRSFDFNAFPSELFSALTVRKTSSADVQEGSLGATVELQAPRPLDYRQDFVLSATGQVTYDDLRRRASPRVSGLISKQFADGTFGVMAGAAYTKRYTREEGYSAVAIFDGVQNGGFCTPIGFTPQNPGNDAVKGSDALNCGTGVPRTSNLAAYQLANSSTTFLPRVPRYIRSDQDYDRLGIIASLQWKPTDRTDISLSGLYSRFDVKRHDMMLSALSFARAGTQNGKPQTSVVEAEKDELGTLTWGRFNGVDVRTDDQTEFFTTTFKQATLDFSHEFSDVLKVDGMIGRSNSVYDNPIRTTISIDANNVDDFTFDLRGGGTIPAIGWGTDVADVNNFVFGPVTADGTFQGLITTRYIRTETTNTNVSLNATFTLSDAIKFRLGGQYRESDFVSVSRGRPASTVSITPSLPAGTSLSSLTHVMTGFGRSIPGGLTSSWVLADYDKFDQTFGISQNQGIWAMVGPEGGVIADNGRIRERQKVAYGMMMFNTDGAIPLRGDFGLRYVNTEQYGLGYVPQGTSSVVSTNSRSYDDWLPALNLAAEFSDKLVARLSWAKVLSRPELSNISPGVSSFFPNQRTVSSGNPLLDPIRASTVDISLEYYLPRGGILSIGGFYKDIETYIQAFRQQIPYSETGLPASLLEGSDATVNDLFLVTSYKNTKGGPLKGVEVNYQQSLGFLPGFLKNVGVLANYTFVDSDITYCTNAPCTTTTSQPMIALSKNSFSGTLYYEDSKFSIRTTGTYRSSFLTNVPAGVVGSDVQGNPSTFYVDAAAYYQITPQIRITLEAQNLTNEHNGYYVDSVRQDTLYDVYSGRKFTIGVNFKL